LLYWSLIGFGAGVLASSCALLIWLDCMLKWHDTFHTGYDIYSKTVKLWKKVVQPRLIHAIRKSKVATKNGCNDVNFNNKATVIVIIIAAILGCHLWFPNFSHPGFLIKAAPLFHSLAVFEQISLLFCNLMSAYGLPEVWYFSDPSSYTDTKKTDL